LGVSKFSAVFFSALAGVGAVALTFKLARYFFAPAAAYLSSFFLLTTPYFTKFARRAMLDVFLAFLYVFVFWAFFKGIEQLQKKERPFWFIAGGAAVGFAVLTKSILGILPLPVMAGFLLLSGRQRMLVNPYFFASVLVSALVAAPWFLGQYLIHGSVFLQVHFSRLVWQRAVVGRYGDIEWYDHLGYIKGLLKNGWPWVLLFFAGTASQAAAVIRRVFPGDRKKNRENLYYTPERDGNHHFTLPRKDAAVFITLWVVGITAVISMAKEGMLRYLMPVFPGMALAAGSLFEGYFTDRNRQRRLVLLTSILFAAGFIAVGLTSIRLTKVRRPHFYQLARVAAMVVPEGEEVLNLNQYYWSINNRFYFYSGRCITFPVKNDAEFVEMLSGGRFGLLPRAEYERLFDGRKDEFPITAESGGWILFKGGEPVHAVLPSW